MIAMSDAVIILVSASALGAGIYRWQNSIDPHTLARSAPPVATITQGANSQPNTSGNLAASNENASPTQAGSALGRPAADLQNIATDGNATVSSQNSGQGSSNTQGISGSSNDNSGPLYGIYSVRSGDSLSLIAQRFGSTVANLQDVNNIKGTLITVGQELLYPLPAN